ncbi:DUF6402 family protein [Erwinia amylovora]|nr:DUF6402 family protein [Erwinia amylovora]MCK8315031.1 DUF6402 family protein [Erwinia amylovora]MCK8325004.1 DUF6402 family protein [Erwinia amylovora]
MNNWLALFDGQSRYVLEIHDSPVHPDVLRFYGREALSEPFTWDIEFTTEQANLAPGQVLMKFVDKLEIMENGEFKSCYLNFSDLTAIELEKKSQFNYIKIGSTLWEKATDDLDDVYGALDSFIIKVAFTDLDVNRDSSGFVRLEIKELGLYVRDTYDFINDGDDQLLGYWGSNGVIKPGVISELMKKKIHRQRK